MYRDYQARLLTKMDKLKQKLIDNQIELIGTPTDCLKVSYKRNDEGDTISRVIEKAELISVIWPELKDVPYRTLDNTDGAWRLTSLVSAHDDKAHAEYEIVTPHNSHLKVGDMLFRVFVDPEVSIPIVLGVTVTEALGTIGQNAIISHKYKCSIYTEDLPEEMLSIIVDLAKRRMAVKF